MIVNVNVILLVKKKNKKKSKSTITIGKEITKVSLAQEGILVRLLKPQAF
jgi:hypothetical protein